MPDFVSSSSGADDPEDSPQLGKDKTDFPATFSRIYDSLEKALDDVSFEQATTEQLNRDQPLETDAVEFEDQERQKLINDNKREEQALQLRKAFFWIAVSLVIVTMAVSCFISVWVVVVMGKVNTPIIVAFISGLAVEALGLMFIIARYLYPNGNKVSEK